MNPSSSHLLRVLHVTNVPFTVKQFLNGQIAYMHDHGVDVHVALRLDGLAGDFDTRGISEVHDIAIPRDIDPIGDLRAVRYLVRLIRRLQPGVVHGHTPKGGLLASIAAAITRTPMVYHCRGLPYTTASGPKRQLLQATERLTLRLADRVLCISPSLREAVRADALCSDAKVTVPGGMGSGNGISATQYDPARHREAGRTLRTRLRIPPESPVIGFVGRLIRQKGIHELIDAFSHLRGTWPDLHLIVVGVFDERDKIAGPVRELMQNSPGIHLVGYQAYTAPWYAAMDVLAFPTYREGFGAVAAEAGAMEVPVVASRVTGCVDSIVDGETGILVTPASADALAAGLERYLRDPALRRRHGVRARQHVLSSFDQERIWGDILSVYQELAARNGDADQAS